MNLHEMTRGMPLEMFILFSSWCSVLGSAGQANHSAANAFLDTLAHYRRAEGLPALSINWGAWTEIGAAARVDRSDNLARQGIGSFTPSQGIEALEFLMAEGATQSAVVPFDLNLWRQVDSLGDKSGLFDLLTGTSDTQSASTDVAERKVSLLLEKASSDAQRREVMEDHLRLQAAQVLRLPTERVDPVKSFKDLGLDSLTGLELRNRLEASLELSLPATLVWNYPSVSKLAGHLIERMGTSSDSPGQSQTSNGEDDNEVQPLEGFLDELEALSDEEAVQLLQTGPEGSRADE
jgi:acyl carrier protein